MPQVQQLLRTSLVVTINMASKSVASKETAESSTGEAFEQISVDLLVYADTPLFIEKGTKLTWQQIKDTFAEDFKEDSDD